MPSKEKKYDFILFTPEVMREAEETLIETLPKKFLHLSYQRLYIELPTGEEWEHDNDEEFFADYRKGFKFANFNKEYTVILTKFPTYQLIKGKIIFSSYVHEDISTTVLIEMPTRVDLERVFRVVEKNVDQCRFPRQPQEKSKAETDWVTETVNKIETHCPVAARKLRLALIKLESENIEEWQNATMLIRDAWIELSQWLCQVNNIDTSDILSDAVIERLKKLKIDKTDERLFNLARASFNLYSKHHKRDIDLDTAVACVISTIVSMKTVIREAL